MKKRDDWILQYTNLEMRKNLLGMPIQSNILGSKKVGELADESCYEIEEELKSN